MCEDRLPAARWASELEVGAKQHRRVVMPEPQRDTQVVRPLVPAPPLPLPKLRHSVAPEGCTNGSLDAAIRCFRSSDRSAAARTRSAFGAALRRSDAPLEWSSCVAVGVFLVLVVVAHSGELGSSAASRDGTGYVQQRMVLEEERARRMGVLAAASRCAAILGAHASGRFARKCRGCVRPRARSHVRVSGTSSHDSLPSPGRADWYGSALAFRWGAGAEVRVPRRQTSAAPIRCRASCASGNRRPGGLRGRRRGRPRALCARSGAHKANG
jgi:hypothetical protein